MQIFGRGRRARTRGEDATGEDDEAPSPEPTIDCAFATALGHRPENQDRCAVSERWLVLSDGAGGHAGGALAAQLTVDAVVSCLTTSAPAFGAPLLELAVRRANEAVRTRRRTNLAVAGMAATLTMAIATSVAEDTVEWLVTSIGDSPAWLVTTAGATRVTEDDNVAAQLLRSGAITSAEALAHPGRHWITRAIGPEERMAPLVIPVQMRRGDALLIASDGLDVLSATTISEVMAATTASQDAAGQLVDEALRSEALDNVSAVVARHAPSTCHRVGDEPAT